MHYCTAYFFAATLSLHPKGSAKNVQKLEMKSNVQQNPKKKKDERSCEETKREEWVRYGKWGIMEKYAPSHSVNAPFDVTGEKTLRPAFLSHSPRERALVLCVRVRVLSRVFWSVVQKKKKSKCFFSSVIVRQWNELSCRWLFRTNWLKELQYV